VNRPRSGLVKPRLGCRKLRWTDHLRPHTVFGRKRLGHQSRAIHRGPGTVQRAITFSSHQRARAGFGDQHAVLGRRLCDDPFVGLRNALVPFGRGMPPVSQQGTNVPGERRNAVMDIVGTSHRDGRQRSKIARHRIGPDSLTLDDAGIAVAGLATR